MVFLNNENNNQGLVKEAIYISNNAKLNVNNSVFSGFRSAINLNKNINEFNDDINNISIEKCIINDCQFLAEKEGYEIFNDIINYFLNDKFNNQIIKRTTKELFINNDIQNQPDFRIKRETIVTY